MGDGMINGSGLLLQPLGATPPANGTAAPKKCNPWSSKACKQPDETEPENTEAEKTEPKEAETKETEPKKDETKADKREDKSTLNPLWMLVPAGAVGGSFVTDQLLLQPLRKISGYRGDPMTLALFGARQGLDMTATWSYTGLQPKLSPRNALIADGAYGVVTLFAGGSALLGDAEDPALHMFIRGVNDIGLARVYRHKGEKFGSMVQIGTGALLMLGGMFVCNTPTQGPDDIYVPPGEDRDPHNEFDEQSRLKGKCSNMILIGANDALIGGFRLTRALTWNKPKGKSDQAAVSLQLLNDGNGINGAYGSIGFSF